MDLAGALEAILGMDDGVRREAEAGILHLLDSNPAQLIELLMGEVERGSGQTSEIAVLMLCRLFNVGARGNAWEAMGDEGQRELRKVALELWKSGKDAGRALHRKLTFLVAQIAARSAFVENGDVGGEKEYVLDHVWSDLFGSALEGCSNDDADVRRASLELLAQIASGVGAEAFESAIGRVSELFLEHLDHDPSPGCRVAAMQAAAALAGKWVEVSDAEDLPPELSALIPSMFRALEECLKSEEATGHEALQNLDVLATNVPSLFRDCVDDAADVALSLAESEDWMPETRLAALELLVSLASFGGAVARRSSVLAERAVPAAVGLFAGVVDDDENTEEALLEWGRARNDEHSLTMEPSDDDPLEDGGITALTRLSHALGGASVMDRLVPLLGELVEDDRWERRRAAAIALTAIGAGARKEILREVRGVSESVWRPLLRDAHPRVRNVTAASIAQVAEVLLPSRTDKTMQEQVGCALVRDLIELVRAGTRDDPIAARVATTAAMAIGTIFNPDTCRPVFVQAVAEPAAIALMELAAHGHIQAQQQAITAVSALTLTMGERAPASVYDNVMPIAKELIDEATPVADQRDGDVEEIEMARSVRNRAFEAIGALFSTVSKEKCREDAGQVVDMLLKYSDTSRFAPSDIESYRYMQRCMVRIAEVMGEDFTPYYEDVLPPLFRVARSKIDVVVLGAGEESPEEQKALGFLGGSSSDGGDMAVEGMGGMGVEARGNTDDLDDMIETLKASGSASRMLTVDAHAAAHRAAAVMMLFVYSQQCADHLGKWIGEVVDVMIEASSDRINTSVRSAAICSFAKLLKASIANRHEAGAVDPQELLDAILELLLSMLRTETVASMRTNLAEVTSNVLQVCFEDGMVQREDGKGWEPIVGIPSDSLDSVLGQLLSLTRLSVAERVDIEDEARKEEGFDEVAEEQLEARLENHTEYVSGLVDSVGWTVKFHARLGSLEPLLGAMLPTARELIGMDRHPMVQQPAFCMYDDLLEFGREEAGSILLPEFLPHVFSALESSNGPLRQSAAYGLGVAAEHSGPHLPPDAIEAAVNALTGMLRSHFATMSALEEGEEGFDIPEEGDFMAVENAASALIKFARFRADHPSVDPIPCVATALTALPFQADQVESRDVLRWYIEAMGTVSPLLLGEDGSALPRVLMTLAECIVDHHARTAADPEEARFDADTLAAIPDAFRAIEEANPDLVAATMEQLPPPFLHLFQHPDDVDSALQLAQPDDDDDDDDEDDDEGDE